MDRAAKSSVPPTRSTLRVLTVRTSDALQSQTTLRGSGGIHPEIWLQLMSSWPWTHKDLRNEFSAETSYRLSIKKKNIALLYDSPVIFQNAIISLCWKFAPAID